MKQVVKAFSVAAISAMAIVPVQSAFAQNAPQMGVLNCNIADATGMVVGSKKALKCTFKHKDGKVQNYTGSLNSVGLDLGKTKNAKMQWGVYQVRNANLDTHPLAGNYVGVSAGATLGKGFGANALVGGNSNAVALQPLSMQTQDGLNINVGLSNMKLMPSK